MPSAGIAPITKFDASGIACQFAGEVKGFNVEDYIPGKDAKHMDTFIHYGVAAAIQAVKDAGLPSREELIAKLLGTMQAPIATFVRTLNEVPSRFVRTLAAVNEKKQGAAA